MNFKMYFLVIFFAKSPAYADICRNWFDASRIKPNSPACLSQCATHPIDMGTFTCHNKCEDFCKRKKCVENLFWKNKFKSGRPKNWSLTSEKSKEWLDSEKKNLNNILQRLPSNFNSLNFNGFYRMETSVHIINPGTTSQNKSIVLYDRAFEHSIFNLDQIVIHELAHVLYLTLSKNEAKSYERALGRKRVGNELIRKGQFIRADAKTSPAEDFAINIETFLFDAETLKSKVPVAYHWIIKKYSENFKLREACREN